MTVAGWYNDPQQAGQLRYWDGNQWTEHVSPAPTPTPVSDQGSLGSAQQSPSGYSGETAAPHQPSTSSGGDRPQQPGVAGGYAQQGQAAQSQYGADQYAGGGYGAQQANPSEAHGNSESVPFSPQSVNQPYNSYGSPSGEYRPVGDLISESFSSLRSALGKLMMIGFGIPLVAGIVFSLIFGALGAGAVGTVGDNTYGAGFAFNGVAMLGAFVAWIAFFFILSGVSLAIFHLMYWRNRGADPSVGESFRRALRRVLPLIGYSLLAGLAVGAVLLVLALLTIGVPALISEDVLVGLGMLVFFLGAIAFLFFVLVKLVFLNVSAAVAPKGTSLIKESFRITKGYFWATLGRLILIGLCSYVFSIPTTILIAILAVLAGSIGGTVAALIFGILIAAVYALSFMLSTGFSASALTSMYLDRNGAATESHSSN